MLRHFDYTGVIARFFLCAFVVFAAYNPGEYSWYHWVMSGEGQNWPLKALTGLALFAAFYVLGRATYQTIGLLGIATVGALNALGIWALYKAGWLGGPGSAITTITVLISITVVLTAGISYGHIYHRMTGVVHTEDVH